jgi:hypothetical protein
VTLTSINETISSGISKASAGLKNMLSEMKGGQVDTLTSCIWNFAKEHHNVILGISIELAESLAFKKVAEFLRIVQFVVNKVQEVAKILHEKYQEDMQFAQTSQGAASSREQFDNECHIEGKRLQHFITTVLTTFCTPEALESLRTTYEHFSKAATSGKEGIDEKGADSKPK